MTDLGAAAKLRAAFELSPTMLAVTDLAEGRIVEVNDVLLRVLGYRRDEIVGRRVPEVGAWVDPAQREAALHELRAGRSVRDMEARFRTRDGAEVVAIANADVVVIEGRACVLTALVDITARVRAEAALRESERRFAQAFNANPLPMSITSLRDGRHLDVNEAALRHSGYTREEMLGRTKPELGFWVAPEQRERLLAALHAEGRARDFEAVFRTRTGEHRDLLVNSEVITYGGEPAVLSVSLDITERKQVEDQREARRVEAEALARAKDEFLAMLGHELRNPLGTLTNALGVLDHLVSDPEARRVVEVMGRQTARLTRLVDDLLDVARVSTGKIELRLQMVDLRALADRCVDGLQEGGRGLDHRVTVEGDAVWVRGDPARLEQIITNLLDNALKYTPAGGEVRLRVGREEGEAVLRVEDTGEGMRADLLPRVFDPFVQEPQSLARARGGLGLGLTLVKRLVELHGGAIAATSGGPGLGSVFTVRLPVASDNGRAEGASTAPPTDGSRRRRVLIVEDNADARESLRLLLTLAGHQVDAADDAPGALDRLEAFRPDVALVDVGLPGVDGYALAQRIRARQPGADLLLVALTGYGQAADRRRALAAGFDVHLTKPVDPARLRALLARH